MNAITKSFPSYRDSRGRQISSGDFDVTISCTYPWINWFLRYSKRRNRDLKNIFVTQNGDRMCHIGHREYRYFTCDGLVTINPEYYETNRSLYPTVLIPNGTDPEVFYPSTSSSELTDIDFEFPKDKTVVLMASAMIESKRVVEGLRSTAQVEDAYFVVAGDGPKRAEVAELAESLMPGRHRLLGSIPATQMPQLFRQADVFLHMSQEEPFGIVYLEAAASGLPIVTHHGATPKWILGDTAVFANTNKFEQVAQAIRLVMDPAERERLGKAARDRVMEDWTWKAQAAKYRKFIHSLTNVEAPANQEDPHAFDHNRQLQHA